MSKSKENELARASAEADLAVKPDFLEADSQLGREQLGDFIVPPRLKIVQPQSKEPFSRLFNKGDVVLVPQNVLVSPVILEDGKPTKDGSPFSFIPLFFFPEWCVWNPYELKGTLPAIRERTLSPNSEIAKRAKVPDLRRAPCPENDKFSIRYVEHLNYMVVLLGDNMTAGMPIVMSFARAAHRHGSNFASLIQMRRAPIFGCIFEGRTRFHENDQGEWYAIEVSNPSVQSNTGGWVTDASMYERLKETHLQLKKAHEEARIVVDHEDVDEELESATEY